MHRKGFTLIELLVVVGILITLMAIVFRIANIGTESMERNATIARLQRLENCLSGYYAAFGSYPPVKLHGSRDIYRKTGSHGIQSDQPGEKWSSGGSFYRQVEAACRSQPVGCRFPYPQGYADKIRAISDLQKEFANSDDENYKAFWENDETKQKFSAGYDDGGSGGGTGRFDSNRDEVDWTQIQVFKFGLMSFLLPRYLVMMNANQDFYRFAQWTGNNVMPCDPFTGDQWSEWNEVKNYADSDNRNDISRLANIPSQAVCARWMPNLEGLCSCNRSFTLFGINISDGSGSDLRSTNAGIEIFSPAEPDSNGYTDQYVLDGITIEDGWHREFYYYSPEPYQSYSLWSSGPNGKTFPPWISRKELSSQAAEWVAEWTKDDIIHLSN